MGGRVRGRDRQGTQMKGEIWVKNPKIITHKVYRNKQKKQQKLKQKKKQKQKQKQKHRTKQNKNKQTNKQTQTLTRKTMKQETQNGNHVVKEGCRGKKAGAKGIREIG